MAQQTLDLCQHQFSERCGFMLEDPPEIMPVYFQPWQELGSNLPELIKKHELRERVHKLPLLDHTKLEDEGEWRLAYTLLTFTTQGYVWQEGDEGAAKVLPRQLAIPLCGVASHVGLPPVVTYVSIPCSIWQVIDPKKPLEISNMRVTYELPGGEELCWFALIHAQIELDAIPAIKATAECHDAMLNQDVDTVTKSLGIIKDALIRIRQTMASLKDKLTGDAFYNRIRPYLAGWGGETSPLPDGLIYEGVEDTPKKFVGGSAAQAVHIQCFDALLGLAHDTENGAYLIKIRQYMLPAHRELIKKLEEGPHVCNFVKDNDDAALHEAHKQCVEALREFRVGHIQTATMYITAPSRAAEKKTSLSETGTGGTGFMPFLKSIRDTTTVQPRE